MPGAYRDAIRQADQALMPPTAQPQHKPASGQGEPWISGDDDENLPAARVAAPGASADPVRDYLRQIGKVPLLTARQEVELAKRIEAGLFASQKLRSEERRVGKRVG